MSSGWVKILGNTYCYNNYLSSLMFAETYWVNFAKTIVHVIYILTAARLAPLADGRWMLKTALRSRFALGYLTQNLGAIIFKFFFKYVIRTEGYVLTDDGIFIHPLWE